MGEPIRLSDILRGLSFNDIIARSMTIRGHAVRDTPIRGECAHCDICGGPLEGWDESLMRELYPLAFFPNPVRRVCWTCAAINHEGTAGM